MCVSQLASKASGVRKGSWEFNSPPFLSIAGNQPRSRESADGEDWIESASSGAFSNYLR
jgi:hypothetical protein